MQYICSKTGDEGSIYAARQCMRACNNNNMCNPLVIIVACPHTLSCCIYTALIPCLAAYILPSSPVLLHIYCPHPLSCSIYTALVSSFFGTLIPTSFNILMKIFLLSYCIYKSPCFSDFWHCNSYILQHCIYTCIDKYPGSYICIYLL